MLRFIVMLVFAFALFPAQASAQTRPQPATSSATNKTEGSTATARRLASEIHSFLIRESHYPDGEIHITLNPAQLEQVGPCETKRLFLPQGSGLRSRTSVGIECFAPRARTRYIQADVQVEGSYYVAARTLDPGTALTAAHLLQRKGDLLRLNNGVLREKDALLGRITTQRIAKNSAIKSSTVRSADSIERGQTVRLEARGTGFTVNTDGVAMQGGEPGSQISVRTRSGQIVTGLIMDAITVVVPL